MARVVEGQKQRLHLKSFKKIHDMVVQDSELKVSEIAKYISAERTHHILTVGLGTKQLFLI